MECEIKSSRHDAFMSWLADFKQQVHHLPDGNVMKGLALQMERALDEGGVIKHGQ